MLALVQPRQRTPRTLYTHAHRVDMNKGWSRGSYHATSFSDRRPSKGCEALVTRTPVLASTSFVAMPIDGTHSRGDQGCWTIWGAPHQPTQTRHDREQHVHQIRRIFSYQSRFIGDVQIFDFPGPRITSSREDDARQTFPTAWVQNAAMLSNKRFSLAATYHKGNGSNCSRRLLRL